MSFTNDPCTDHANHQAGLDRSAQAAEDAREALERELPHHIDVEGIRRLLKDFRDSHGDDMAEVEKAFENLAQYVPES